MTIALGNNAVCMLTNTARQPQLTLVKTVVNDNGGTAEATDWTLSADGPTPISGAVGEPTVTNAAVEIGTYTPRRDRRSGRLHRRQLDLHRRHPDRIHRRHRAR